MRSVVWSLMTVAAVALTGCSNSSNPSSSGADGAAPTGPTHSITGTVTLRGGTMPSAQGKLDVSIVDVTAQGSTPLASKTIAPATFPQSFSLDFNPANVATNDLYIVQATLTDGDRHYAMPIQAPVLTQGHPTANVAIELAPEQTPGEKMLAAFVGAQKQIGALKPTSGTKLEANASRAWQVFRDGTEVKFIRELVDYGDKGFTDTYFAYKDGKPWVVQQKKTNQSAHATSTDSAGWDDDGSLVLKLHEAGGSTSTMSDSDAASLQQQAKDTLNLATGGKGK